MVPLVPKLAVITPSRVFPVPMAPIMLSPPPALTRIPAFRSRVLAVAGCKHDPSWATGGNHNPTGPLTIGKLESHDPRFEQLVAPNAKIEKLAELPDLFLQRHLFEQRINALAHKPVIGPWTRRTLAEGEWSDQRGHVRATLDGGRPRKPRR